MTSADAIRARRNDLDWIRILAVLCLIPFHSARVFDVFEDFYVKNPDLSAPLSDIVIRFIGAWQMPILFLVAGASTWYALRFRNGGQYIAERLKRLLVPFFFGTVVLVPPQMYFALRGHGGTTATYPDYLPRFFEVRPDNLADYTGIGLSWAHLWFILDLFIISVLALPILFWLRSSSGRRFVGWMAGLAQHWWAILLPLLPVAISSELPRPDNKPFFQYLLLFVIGFALMSDDRFGQIMRLRRWWSLGLAAATMAVMYAVLLTGTKIPDDSLADLLFFLLRNLNLLLWLAAILGLGQQYMTADGPVLRYARDAAYPFYLIHQTVIVAIAFYLVQWDAPVLPKYLALVASSFVVTVVLFDVAVWHTNVTRFLFGMRPKARPSPERVPEPVAQAGG